jgi:hypothetical protein
MSDLEYIYRVIHRKTLRIPSDFEKEKMFKNLKEMIPIPIENGNSNIIYSTVIKFIGEERRM